MRKWLGFSLSFPFDLFGLLLMFTPFSFFVFFSFSLVWKRHCGTENNGFGLFELLFFLMDLGCCLSLSFFFYPTLHYPHSCLPQTFFLLDRGNKEHLELIFPQLDWHLTFHLISRLRSSFLRPMTNHQDLNMCS